MCRTHDFILCHFVVFSFHWLQRHLIINLLGLNDTSIFYENLKQRVSERICMSHERIESLGLLDETPVVKLNTPLDTLSYYLSKRLAFGKIFTMMKIYVQ